MNDAIKKYVNDRDAAVIECWDKNSVEPITKLMADNQLLFEAGSLEKWNSTSDNVKWLTVAKMTLSITTMEEKYKSQADAYIKAWREKKAKA